MSGHTYLKDIVAAETTSKPIELEFRVMTDEDFDEDLQEEQYMQNLKKFLSVNSVKGSEFKKSELYIGKKFYICKPYQRHEQGLYINGKHYPYMAKKNSCFREQPFSTIEYDGQLIKIFTTENIDDYICYYDDYAHWGGCSNWNKKCEEICEIVDIPNNADVCVSYSQDGFIKDNSGRLTVLDIYVSKVQLGKTINVWSDKDLSVEILQKNKNNRATLYYFMNKELITKDILDQIYEDELREDIKKYGYTNEIISTLYKSHPSEVTYEMCINAVEKSGTLHNIPTNYVTQELGIKSMNMCAENIHYIPKELRNDVMYDIVLNCDNLELYRYLPYSKFTQEYCDKIIDKYATESFSNVVSNMLKNIPNDLKTRELITKCLNINSNLIVDLDSSLINYEDLTMAISHIKNTYDTLCLHNIYIKHLPLIDEKIVQATLDIFQFILENIDETKKKFNLTREGFLGHALNNYEKIKTLLSSNLLTTDVLHKILKIEKLFKLNNAKKLRIFG